MIDRRHVVLGGLAGLVAGQAGAQLGPGQAGGPPGGGPPGGGQLGGGLPGGAPQGGGRQGLGGRPDQAGGEQQGRSPLSQMDQPAQPQPPQIRALVVSQSYVSTPDYALANTTRDAALVGRSFQRLKLDAVSAMADTGPDQTLAGIAGYLNTVDANTIALVYAAGHGLEIGGENLLMLDGGRSFLSLQSLVQALRQRAGIAVLFLDACRNNPFAGAVPAGGRLVRALPSSGDNAGLQLAGFDALRTRGQAGQIRPFVLQGSGIRIVFSTDPANVAYDGVDGGRNSPFAQALARLIRWSASLDDIVSMITGEVLRATQRQQSPWSQGSIDRPIFLSGPRRRLQSRLSEA